MKTPHPSSDEFDEILALPMFVVSLTFLLLLAGLLHLHESDEYRGIATFCHYGLICLHPLFVVELLLHVVLESRRWRQNILFCLIPPLRLGARDHATGRSLWLPRIGWVKVDLDLRERAEKAFSLPMIIVAVMVLPLLGVELVWKQQIASNPTLSLATHVSEGLVWFAFTFEFVLMISIVSRKFRYCKDHWIDVAVIFLPLVAFLRAARLGRLLRLQQLTKTAKVFRVRGTVLRAYRSILMLDVIDRLFRAKPEVQLLRLEEAMAEKEREIEELREEMDHLKERLASSELPLKEAA